MEMLTTGLLVGGGLAALSVISTLVASSLRRVVPSNEVHIVQSSRSTLSYGSSTTNGNTYYEWPTSLPVLGVTKSVFPISVFDLDLVAYEAYDKGRLPFVVDVKAFFRITDSNVAAQRVASFEELHNQLKAIVQGAVRTILASSEIEEIMAGRSKFGKEFTEEVDGQLASWGVSTVKSIELMDIRDHKDTNVIQNIMAKKKSHIEMESRTEVAKNKKNAEMAEIDAKKEVDLQSAAAKQQVGLRTTQSEREVALAEQEKIQALKEQEKTTKEKEMAVLKIQQTRQAEITKEVAIVKAEQEKSQALIAAEADRQKAVITSSGQLEATKNRAEGIAAEGKAKADAERLMLSAPVEAQITLAKEIGANKEYQQYLVTIEQVKANAEVGKAQAEALKAADIKVIANSGSVTGGIHSLGELISSKGGLELGSMLESFANTGTGKALLAKIMPDIEAKDEVKETVDMTSTAGNFKLSMPKTTGLNGKA